MSWKRFIEIGRSMTFAVILLSFLAISALVGVMWKDQEAAKQWIYHAWWFKGIFLFLIADLLLAIVAHADRTWRYAAYFLTHGGMIVTLVGFGIGSKWGMEGYLMLDAGKHSSQLNDLNPQTNRLEPRKENSKLPFEVFLERFSIDYYPPLSPYLLASFSDTKKEFKIPLDRGERLQSPDSKYRIEVLERLAGAEQKFMVVNRSDQLRNPAVKARVQFQNRKAAPFQGYLFSVFPAIPVMETPLLVLDFKYGLDESAWNKQLQDARQSLEASLTFEDENTGEGNTLPVVFNRDQSLGKTGYRLRMLRAVSGVKVDMATKKTEELTGPPVNPALRVEIRATDGRSHERYVFAEPPPPFMEQKLRGPFDKLKLEYRYAPPLGKDFCYLMLHSSDGQRFSIVSLLSSGKTRSFSAALHEEKFLQSEDLRIQIQDFLPDAAVEEQVVPREGGQPAIHIRIDGVLGEKKKWLMLNAERGVEYPDHRLSLRYVQDPPAIRQYHSAIRFLDEGKPEKSAVVSVNDPVSHEKYTFYQIDYDKERGQWSVLKVVSNPGTPVLFTGFGMLFLGVLGMVLTRPQNECTPYCAIVECADGINNGRGIPIAKGCSEGATATSSPTRMGGAGLETDGADLDVNGSGISVLELYRPTPNPFSNTTSFAYQVGGSAAQRVQIGIYDVAGRLIRELVNDTKTPGRYETVWNGQDQGGSSVSHGVYFIRAYVGGVRVGDANRILYLR